MQNISYLHPTPYIPFEGLLLKDIFCCKSVKLVGEILFNSPIFKDLTESLLELNNFKFFFKRKLFTFLLG